MTTLQQEHTEQDYVEVLILILIAVLMWTVLSIVSYVIVYMLENLLVYINSKLEAVLVLTGHSLMPTLEELYRRLSLNLYCDPLSILPSIISYYWLVAKVVVWRLRKAIDNYVSYKYLQIKNMLRRD